MNLLTIMGAPVLIIIGFPLVVAGITALTLYLQARKASQTRGAHYGEKPMIQWRYPIGFGVASLVILLLMAYASQ